MLLSCHFAKTSKDAASDATSINADLLTRAGFIHKTMAGVYSYLPLGLRVIHSLEQIVREEMDSIGGQEILMSALAPKENWDKTGRWETLDVLYKVKGADEKDYALNPTHEEIITPLVKEFVNSYKDLPFSAYQIQTKFRNELRAKSGIMRGREFIMKDLYSFHADQESLDAFYEKVQEAYDRVWARVGLTEKTYLTYASGGSFAKYSHEYQVVLPSGEDTIYISVEAEKQGKRIAINKEIFVEGETKCPVTGGSEFRTERASEVGNIFKLGTRFSEPFKLTFNNDQGQLNPVIMGCYGLGISRLMGIIAEAFADTDGVKWPANIAPAQAHIVAIAKAPEDESFLKAQELYTSLTSKGIKCLFDDRIGPSVGAKLAIADLIGAPKRIILSPKTLADGNAEVKDRHTGEVTMQPLDGLMGLFGK
jgi:prolyl-tRNA synthetase